VDRTQHSDLAHFWDILAKVQNILRSHFNYVFKNAKNITTSFSNGLPEGLFFNE
jgi:hypothetical protein